MQVLVFISKRISFFSCENNFLLHSFTYNIFYYITYKIYYL